MKVVIPVCCLIFLSVGKGLYGQTRNSVLPRLDKIRMEGRFTIDTSNDGRERQFPFVYKFGRNIFVSYAEHPDGYVASPEDAMIISRDNGRTWSDKIKERDFCITSMVKKDDTLYAIVYFTYPYSAHREKMIYWTSVDMGKSWTKREGVVNAPQGSEFIKIGNVWGSMLFHRGMMVMKDGSIEGLMYGYLGKDKRYCCVWVRSLDNCASWKIISTIASAGPMVDFKDAEGYGEPSFVKTRDNSLLCVMRIGSNLPLFQSRSYDDGITWSKPRMLPGLSATRAKSVDPQLLLMNNGVLALTYGRPGDKIAFSTDGCGYKWDCSLYTYTGQTTGYTGIVEASPGKLLLVADQGRTGAKKKSIWGRIIDVNIAPSRAVNNSTDQ